MLTNDFAVSKDYAEATCKFGQGPVTCRWLMMGEGGFECAKLNLGFRELIEKLGDTMKAKGDNCAGKPDELAKFLFE